MKSHIQCHYLKKIAVDTWITVLAPSGSAKTFSFTKIEDLIPIKPDGKSY
jgi:hypothetical protein